MLPNPSSKFTSRVIIFTDFYSSNKFQDTNSCFVTAKFLALIHILILDHENHKIKLRQEKQYHRKKKYQLERKKNQIQ